MGMFGFFKSKIGQKYLVAITGLFFSLFVFSHALGNFLLFVGPEAYNTYSHKLVTNPLIIVAELGLVVLLILHMSVALSLTLSNFSARPEKYQVTPQGEKATSKVTQYMWAQGIIIFIFTVFHLKTFKYGPQYSVEYDGVVMRDIFRLVSEVFQSPLYVLGYVVVMLLLGLHLSHGLQSVVKTLGFNHPQYEGKIRVIGYILSFFIALGFSVQPIYMFFFQ